MIVGWGNTVLALIALVFSPSAIVSMFGMKPRTEAMLIFTVSDFLQVRTMVTSEEQLCRKCQETLIVVRLPIHTLQHNIMDFQLDAASDFSKVTWVGMFSGNEVDWHHIAHGQRRSHILMPVANQLIILRTVRQISNIYAIFTLCFVPFSSSVPKILISHPGPGLINLAHCNDTSQLGWQIESAEEHYIHT